MLIVTAAQMKELERRAQESGYMSYERMMENAGSAAAAVIKRTVPVRGKYITIFCGRGNNGGDGLVAARRLYEAGANVAVVLTDGAPQTGQAAVMFELVRKMEIAVVEYGTDAAYLTERLADTDILVDAIYGTGFHGALSDRHRDICRLINGIEAQTFALDIPSGVHADTGFADEHAVRADMTIVFDSDKPATVLPAAQKWCGQVVVADIGIPPEAREGIVSNYTLVDADFVFSHLKKRQRETHKGSYGRLLNVAGSQNYMGAAALSTLAAMRTGAGYVMLASTKEVCRTVLPMLPEAVFLPLRQLPDGSISAASMPELLKALAQSSAVLAGNGMGMDGDTQTIIVNLIKRVKNTLVLDADGINALARNIDILKTCSAQVILTPHPGEFARLTGQTDSKAEGGLLAAGLSFAREHGVVVVLKDAYTTTVTPQGHVYINTTGNAGLAKAGSGDVLAGIIASLAAQGYTPEIAAACGVFLHGLAADYAVRGRSEYALLARDVVEMLPAVFGQAGR